MPTNNIPGAGPQNGHGSATITSTRWSEIEDSILTEAVARNGVSRWDDVARLIWTRNADECRERWAQLAPLLHDKFARRESNAAGAVEQCKVRRSMTVSISPSASSSFSVSQEQEAYSQPPPLLPQQGWRLQPPPIYQQLWPRQEPREEVSPRVHEPPSPFTPPTLSTPTVPTPSAQTLATMAVSVERTRRNTVPASRAFRATATGRAAGVEQPQREWLAPHPLMPGRPRKQG
ncbi:Myblike DNAbinding domain-containing protein [Parahypoxylon ruwenzoriense]